MVDLTDRIEHRRPPGRRAPGSSAVPAGTLLAGIAAIVGARWATGTGYVPAPFGLPDPGPLTAIGLPAAQYIHELAGVAVVGLLFLRSFALHGGAGPGGAHLLLMATRWAWLWMAATAAWIAFTMSELTGIPVGELPAHPDQLLAVTGTDRILAELATLWIALAVALLGARLSGPVATGGAVLLATAALLPSALTGHAGHHDSPTLAVVMLAVHLAAAAIWVGGLLALVIHLRPFPEQLQGAVRRFSTAALLCVIAIGLSGVVESIVTLQTWTAL